MDCLRKGPQIRCAYSCSVGSTLSTVSRCSMYLGFVELIESPDILNADKVPGDGSLNAVFALLSPGKSCFPSFLRAQRQTARRLPEANAGCLSRNRRLFDERNGASHRGRDFKDLCRKSSGWRRAVQSLCVRSVDPTVKMSTLLKMKNNGAWSSDQSPRVLNHAAMISSCRQKLFHPELVCCR